MYKLDRSTLDEALANMFCGDTYKKSYLFYAHIISKCNIKLSEDFPALAGVAFKLDHYDLYINIQEFSELPLIQRLGVLKHECEHILNNHVARLEDRNHEAFNIASDCAINQFIEKSHLPDYAIRPENYPCEVEINKNSEYYYDMLIQHAKNNPKQDGKGQDGKGQGKQLDNHDIWNESDGDTDLQKDITKKMIEDSMNETIKAKGDLPNNISDMLSLFTRTSKVNWKTVLKQIVGNKKSNKRSTIMRRPRRFPDRVDLKGTVKDRTFTLVVGVDVSGSMSTEEILSGLNEIYNICLLTKTKMKMIQIDSQIHKIEDFSKDTKLFERSGNGGTYMGDCPKYIMENNLECDALIMISDMAIEDVPTDGYWNKFKKRVMWLKTSDVDVEWNGWNNHKIFDLKD